jgi:hypothetical protein
MLPCNGREEPSLRDRGIFMRVKAIAVLVVVAASAALFLAMRTNSRADAAARDCYASAKGPSTPTICE